MNPNESIFDQLTKVELDAIKSVATRKTFREGELIFAEGDPADNIYFIETGRVSIYIEKFTSREEIQALGPGTHFGEMAVLQDDTRNASAAALEPTTLLGVASRDFVRFMESNPEAAARIREMLALRSEELLLKENLIDLTGLKHRHLHVTIKGDPSMRESALFREPYESIVDRLLPDLVPRFIELMLNRCLFQVYIGFNSGEIRTSSVLDPFNEEIHPAGKLLGQAYIDRHFPEVSYAEKTALVRRVFGLLETDPAFDKAPPHLKRIYSSYHQGWEPVGQDEIRSTISRLPLLRSIPNLYLRNCSISIMREAIRMQFNCDGTHIVSTEDFARFLEANLDLQDGEEPAGPSR